jgi:peptide/nickel transport system substrate-binding protein
VKVDAMPRRTFFPRVSKRDTSLYLYSWGGVTDPLLTLIPVMHSRNARGDGNVNLGGYADSRIDAAIDAARVEMDAAARKRLVLEALRLHREGFYDIPLHVQMTTWAARANVQLVHRPDDWLQASWVRIR